MPNNPYIRKLFREIPPAQAGLSLGARVRSLLAASINLDGSSRRNLQFLREYPRFKALIHRRNFPQRPSEIRPIHAVALPSAISALEFTALSLLPVVEQLSSFEALRDAMMLQEEAQEDSIVTVQDPLSNIETLFGFSNWLAGQYVGLLPTHSQQQSSLAKGVIEDSRTHLTKYFIQEKYALSCYSLGASNAPRYLTKKAHPQTLGAFLALALDPMPSVTPERVCTGLAISQHLGALDRWMLLLRALEGLIVAGEHATLSQLAPEGSVHKLLREVRSVEGYNVARELGIHPSYDLPSPTLMDEALIRYATGAPDPTPQPLRTALEGLSRPTDWFGTLAIIDRAALALCGTRTGGMLAATGSQVSALSERRALRAMKWFTLSVHPAVLDAIPQGNLSRLFRINSTPSDRRPSYISATNAALAGNFTEAAHLLADLTDSTHSHEESALLLDVLLTTGDSDRAVDLAASMIVADSPIQRRLPFDELDAILPADPAPDTRRAVMRAIVAEACVRHGASADHSKRNDSLDDVLSLNQTRLPSRCVKGLLESHLPWEHIVYFLERLCTPPIMDTVPVGRSTEELFTERIRVLNALRELVPTKAPEYEPELRQVATMIAAKKEMAALDQQRVYVDVEGLRARLSVQLAEDFERYRRFCWLDPRINETGVWHRTLRERFPDLEILDIEEWNRSLATEADAILAKMISCARDEFASGQDFGLDGYLSGGIRHGNLEGHLREPFVKRGLLGTFKQGGEFSAPDVAAQLGSFIGDAASMEQCFRTFANTFQDIVDEVLSEWVRIESAHVENSRAIFNLSISRVDLLRMENTLRSCTNVDAASDELVRYWLARVDYCLAQARERIRGELAERLHSAHETLAADLRRALATRTASQVQDIFLDNLVAPVRGSVDASLSRLCEWFQRPGNMAEGAIDSSIPIQISISLMQQMHPKTMFAWDVSVLMDGWRIPRSRVKAWVDITHTLFMNAIKYCGSDVECAVSVRLTRDGEGTTKLVVSNRLAPSVNRRDVDEAIERVVSRLAERSPIQAEGGTGLPKIQKWARVDLRCPNAHVIPDRLENEFRVTVTLPSPIQGLVPAEYP